MVQKIGAHLCSLHDLASIVNSPYTPSSTYITQNH